MKIAILGASYLQVPLIKKANEMGLETHVFAWEEGAVGKELASYFYPISILDKDAIIDKCINLNINGIVSVGSDLAVETVNYVASELNLVGNSSFTSTYTRDKSLMRTLFKENNLPTVDFFQINSKDDLSKLELTFPIMVKATDRSGSRGINYVTSKDELFTAYTDSFNASLSKKVICEHYFEGKQYSIEMISQNGIHYFVGITEEFYSGPPFFVETGHIVPADISDNILNKIIDIIKGTLDVVKMEFGASHTEIRVNEKGEYCIIEIASRMGGDFRDLMVLNSYKYDFLKNVINVSLGKKIEIPEAIKYNYSFVKWVFSNEDTKSIKKRIGKIEVIEMNLPVNKELIENDVKDSSRRYGYLLGKSVDNPKDFFNF